MAEPAALRATVHGKVQGVYFRAFVAQEARERRLAGYVRNLPEGTSVEVEAEGDKKKLEQLLARLKVGPPASRVTRVDVRWSEYTGRYTGFTTL